MRRTPTRFRRHLATRVIFALLLAAMPAAAAAMCCPVPCNTCWITAQGQLNFVSFDRANGRIDLVPNIRFLGVSPDFALVVPTPSLPAFAPVSRTIWDEAAQLTAPIRSTRSNSSGCDCGEDFVSSVVDDGSPTEAGDGVTIHGRETIGGLVATTLSSDSPGALVRWLDENGFEFTASDSARFAPYVEREWYFTTMRPDTANAMPFNGWNADVAPVRITFAATELEVPLPLITINQNSTMTVQFYVVDDRRVDLPGFATLYANRVSESEHAAIAERFPTIAALVAPGRYLTKLSGVTTPLSGENGSILLAAAKDNDEFRVIAAATPRALPGELVLFACAFIVLRRRRR
ncbi:MAG: DUF2330 domain-containing protein [bacterium]